MNIVINVYCIVLMNMVKYVYIIDLLNIVLSVYSIALMMNIHVSVLGVDHSNCHHFKINIVENTGKRKGVFVVYTRFFIDHYNITEDAG